MDLVALVESYKNISGKNNPFDQIFEAAGVPKGQDTWNKYIAGYGDLKEQYKNAPKPKAAKNVKTTVINDIQVEDIEATVKLKLNRTNVAGLKKEIQRQLGTVQVKIDNAEVDAAVNKAINGKAELQSQPKVVEPNKFDGIKKQLSAILALQDKVKAGNKDLTPLYADGGKRLATPGINPEDIWGKSVKKSAIQNLVKEYNEVYERVRKQDIIDNDARRKGQDVAENPDKQLLAQLKEKITLYSASYKDLASLISFDTPDQNLWSKVIEDVHKAAQAQESYLQIVEQTRTLFIELSKLTGKTFGAVDFEGFNKALTNGSAVKYVSDLVKSTSVETDKQITKTDASKARSIDLKINPISSAEILKLKKQVEAGLQNITIGISNATVSSGVQTKIKTLLQSEVGDLQAFVKQAEEQNLTNAVKTKKGVTVETLQRKLNNMYAKMDVVHPIRVDLSPTIVELLDDIKVIEKDIHPIYVELDSTSIKQLKENLSTLTKDKVPLDIDTTGLGDSLTTTLSSIESLDATKFNTLATSVGELETKLTPVASLISQIREDIAGIDGEKLKNVVATNKQKEKKKTSKFDPNNLNDQQAKKRDDAVEKYKNAFKNFFDDKGNFSTNAVADTLLDRQITLADNKSVNLRSYVDKQYQDANDAAEKLKDGTFKTEKELNALVDVINQAVTNIKGVLTDENKVNPDSFERIANLDDLSGMPTVSQIKDILSKRAGVDKVLEATNYVEGQGSKVKWVENGRIMSGTIELQRYATALDEVEQETREAGNAQDELENALQKVSVNLKKVRAGKDYFNPGTEWLKGLKHKISNLAQYITGAEILNRAWMKVREGFNFVKELDTTMTTIYQTMDITTEGLKELSAGAIEAAQNLGAVSDQVIDSINIYAAYGETVDSILRKATPTVMLANAAQSDATTASDQIQAVIQQFTELEGQEARIVNAYEKIAANVQIDFTKGIQNIAEGVQVAGSVAKDSGLEFEQFAATVAKVSERTRMEGSTIGNAMKTIMARTSRSKSADDDTTASERGQAAAALNKIGINVYDSSGAYQDFGATLDQLAARWDTLTDAQRANIAESMAGVRNINMMTAIIETWSEAQELANSAIEDSAYYLEVQDKWMESMQAKINSLQATLEQFWYQLVDSEIVDFGVKTLESILKLLTNILDISQKIGTFIGGDLGGSLAGAGSIAATIAMVAGAWDSFWKKDADGQRGGVSAVFTNGAEAAKKFGTECVKAFGVVKTDGLIAGVKTLSAGIGVGTTALLGFSAVLTGILIGVRIFDAVTTSTEEAAEAAEKAAQAYEKSQSSLKSNRQTIDEIGSEYERLSGGVDQFGRNLSLTSTEYERYHEICNQIANMYPHLVRSYDEQGNAVLNLTGKVRELNAEYEKQRINSARENLQNLSDYQENFDNLTGNRSDWTEVVDGFWNTFSIPYGGHAEVGKAITAQDAIDALKEVQTMSRDEFYKKLDKLADLDGAWSTKIESYLTGDEVGLDDDLSLENYNLIQQTKIPELIAKYTQEVQNAASPLKQALSDYITVITSDGGSYGNVDQNVIEQVRTVIANSTTKQLQELNNDEEKLKDYVNGWINTLNNSSVAQTSLSNILGITGDTSLEDIKYILERDFVALAKELDIDKEDLPQLKVQLGIDDEEVLVKKYGKTVESISKTIKKQQSNITKETKKTTKQIKIIADRYDDLTDSTRIVKEYIEEQGINTEDELTLLQHCVDTTDSWAEAVRKFELHNISEDFEAILENLESNLTVVEESIEKINEAIDASNSSLGLSAEQIENVVAAFEGLEGYDYDKLFESTASGVRLNAYELEKLNDEYVRAKKLDYDKNLRKLNKEYQDLCVALTGNITPAEKLDLIAKRNTVKNQIDKIQELTSRYNGLTSAYTRWQNAQETTDSYDMYDKITSGFEEIDELYQRDLTGVDDFKTYMQQFFYGDLDKYLNEAGMSYEQFYKNNAAMIQKYFTEDNTGSINFLNELAAKGFAWKNELGQWEIDGDVEEIAKSFKWATSTIDAQFKKLEAHEFKFQFVETDPLDDLKKKAQETANVISTHFGAEYKFDFNTEGMDVIDGYISQLEGLKKQSGLTTTEIDALNDQINYWTARKGELTKAVEVDFGLNKPIAELEICVDLLRDLEKNVDINLNPGNVSEAKNEIDKAGTLLKELISENNGSIDLDVKGHEEALTILGNLIRSRKALEDTAVVMDVNTEQVSGNLGAALQNIQKYRSAIQDLETIKEINSEYNLNLDTTNAQKAVDDALASLKNTDKGILTKLQLDPTASAEEINNSIASIDTKLLIEMGVNEDAIIGYNPDKKESTVVYDVDRTKVDAFLNKNLDRSATLTYEVKTKGAPTIQTNNPMNIAGGTGGVNGTAHHRGTALLQRGMAFAQGVWGAAQNASSLVGELGRELVVRGNRWFTVGDNGAEFTDIQKGDIVFNHKQTEEILKNGYVTSRGHMVNANGNAHASGNAYLEGNAYALVGALGEISPGRYTTIGSDLKENPSLNKNLNNANKSLKKSSDDAKDEFLEVMDWVEIMIDRLEREIQRLDTIAGSAYKNFTKRNQTLVEEFGKVADEIELQQAAYDTYMKRAESVALSEEYKQKVRDGKLQIEDITDEKLKEKIDDYQEWVDKALDCRDAITDLNEQLGDIQKAKFDNVNAQFEALRAEIDDSIEQVETGLDIVEAKGNFASKQYFTSLMSMEKENIAVMEKQYVALQQAFSDAMASGKIEEGSEAYYDMQQQIRDVAKSLQEADLALIEYKNDMWEMDWSAFEYGQSLIEELTKESEFLIDLLSFNENDLFSKVNGKLTDSGFAVAGLRAVNYNTYMAQAEEYEKKMKEVNAELAKDPTNTILIDKKNEYLDAQREAIRNANDEKMAVHDLIEESYNKMLEILQELIDKRREALQAEKD